MPIVSTKNIESELFHRIEKRTNKTTCPPELCRLLAISESRFSTSIPKIPNSITPE